jgi:3-deoxy-D-manno-octulosonic acid (KDO) 8-phosphate synthase
MVTGKRYNRGYTIQQKLQILQKVNEGAGLRKTATASTQMQASKVQTRSDTLGIYQLSRQTTKRL